MALEKRVIETCKQCAMEFIEDIEQALVEAKAILKIPKLPEWIADLVDNALREQIHFARHASNRKLKREHGAYGGPGKVGSSTVLSDVAESVYQKSCFNHTINGWLIGDIHKGDLDSFAAIEEEKAAGSTFNAILCRTCAKVCAKRKGETVRECLKETELQKMFKDIYKAMGRDAA